MNRFNPEDLTHADLVVGIQTKNHVDTLPQVVGAIAKGLQNYFPDFISAIINIDGSLQDETRTAFLSTGTAVPKIYFSCPDNMIGRGKQIYLLLKEMLRLNARATVVIDLNSASITPEWVRELATPILYGYDFVTPVYSSLEPDDSVGSNVCYPLIYGLLGKDIRNPSSGDIALSADLAEYCLSQTWSDAAQNHGVDIFMTLQAVLGKFECCQVALGSKLAKSPKENFSMRHSQIVEVLFQTLLANKNSWLAPVDVKDFRLFGEMKTDLMKSAVHLNDMASTAIKEFQQNRHLLESVLDQNLFARLREMYDCRSVIIDSQMWMQILYESLYHYDKTDLGCQLIKSLEALYIGRLITLLQESAETEGVLEKLIKKQAECFYKFRNLLTQKYEYQLAVA